jgi:4-alpha-glucanotransferase
VTVQPDDVVRALALRHGIETRWRDVWGREREVEIDVLRALLQALGVDTGTSASAARDGEPLPPLLTCEPGERLTLEITASAPSAVPWTILTEDGHYHAGEAEITSADGNRLRLALTAPGTAGYARLVLQDGDLGETTLAVAPSACPPPPARRGWGVGVQVYALPGNGPGEIGHLGRLAQLCDAAAAAGADAVAISPVHALFAADPGHYSPYAPSDRQFRNGLLAEPSLEAGAASFAATAELIDYGAAGATRLQALRQCHDAFARMHLGTSDVLDVEFQAFRQAGGVALERHACFEALHAWQFQADPAMWDWRGWPAPLQRPDSAAVRSFAQAHEGEIAFHAFLQWLADRQLAAAQEQARAAGMSVGLIGDLAVGTHPGGSRAWSDGAALLRGASIGAPPDFIAPQGQDWGVTAFAPTSLVAQGFAPYLADIRAAMRHGGGVRVDHIMGLQRLWTIPSGATADCGAYLRMPWTDLARLTALEATRHDCIVIGEDLGTVPDGFRAELERRNIFGMRVLWFERDDAGRFRDAGEYPSSAVAMTSTHDLPSAVGWWSGRDIDWRDRLSLLGQGVDPAQALRERRDTRDALWAALLRAGLVESANVPEALDTATMATLVRFLTAAPAPLLILPIEDLLLLAEQPNLPGTTTEHPNWRRRVPGDVARWFNTPPASTIIRALAARGRHSDTT